jgi:hypothetical protein
MNHDIQIQIYAGWAYYGVKLCAQLADIFLYKQKTNESTFINIREPIYLYLEISIILTKQRSRNRWHKMFCSVKMKIVFHRTSIGINTFQFIVTSKM